MLPTPIPFQARRDAPAIGPRNLLPAARRRPRAAAPGVADPPLPRRRLRRAAAICRPSTTSSGAARTFASRSAAPALAPLLVRGRDPVRAGHHRWTSRGPGRTAAHPRDPTRPASRSATFALGAIWTARSGGRSARSAGSACAPVSPTHTTAFQLSPPADPDRRAGHLRLPVLLPHRADGHPGWRARALHLRHQRRARWSSSGPNGKFLNGGGRLPTVVFWDSHLAIGYAPFDFLGASVELGTDIQINNVDDPQFPINNLRSAWVAPAIQLHLATTGSI